MRSAVEGEGPMRTTMLLPLAALSACTMYAGDRETAAASADEAAATDALAGRSAGTPVSCVRQQDVRNSRSAGGNAILFDGPGGTVYLNRASGTCPVIQPWHAIRLQTSHTNMCAGELIRVFDPQTGVEYGGCTLGEFVPYRRTG